MGERGAGDWLYIELDGVTNTFVVGFGDVDMVTMVVFFGWPKISSMDAVRGPHALGCRLFMRYNFGAQRSKWCLIEVEDAIEEGVCAYLGIKAGWAEHVQSSHTLGDESASEMDWPVLVGGG